MSVGILVVLFALVALAYSSVGFGGGSSYTAILAWRGESPEVIRLVSLSCNLVVVVIGGWASLRAKVGPRHLLRPLLLSSVPAVWLGARWEISDTLFFQILGVALAVAGGLLLFGSRKNEHGVVSCWKLLLLGAVLGGLAGVTGIGGGIYLVPVLHLLSAGKAREIAAVGTWFILVNSVVGLLTLGFSAIPVAAWKGFCWLPLAVAGGGLVGSQLLQGKLNEVFVRRWTGVLVLVVAGRVLFF